MKISIVTPCFNEEDGIAACAAEVARVMATDLAHYDYEHIFCDNASTDSTVSILRGLAARDTHIKVVVNSRNVGPLRNISNGLRYTVGDLVVPFVPADIQDPPSVIPKMVTQLTRDLDVVYGVRSSRRESLPLKLGRTCYYGLVKLAGGGSTPPSHAGEFLLARRHVIDAVTQASNRQSYVRGLVAQTEPRYTTVEYEWGLREHGKSRNSYGNLIDQGLTGLVTTARAPMRWAMPVGFLLALFGIGYAIFTLIAFIFGNAHASPGIATLIVGVFFFGGVQVLLLGIIGEYVMSIHRGVNPPPPVVERELINFKSRAEDSIGREGRRALGQDS